MDNSLGARGFHHVALAVSDFDASVKFYRDGLGLPIFRAWGAPGNRAVMLAVGEVPTESGESHGRSDAGYIELFERPDHRGEEGRLLHLALRVADCRAAHAAALEAGAREKVAPKDIEIPSNPVYPVTISFVTGPDGEEIEFFQEH